MKTHLNNKELPLRNPHFSDIQKAFSKLWPFHDCKTITKLINARKYNTLIQYFEKIEIAEKNRFFAHHPFYDENYHKALQDFIKLLKAQKTLQSNTLEGKNT